MNKSPVDVTKLDARRIALGMTKTTLARRSGLPLPTVRRILSAAKRPPPEEAHQAIAAALGVQLIAGPRPTFVETSTAAEFRRQRALEKARPIVRMVQGTMALESQGLEQAELNKLTEYIVRELLIGPNRRLWDE